MVGIERDRDSRALLLAPDVEPFRVHAVAGAVQAAAGDAFVRLHEVIASCLPGGARRARERGIAPGAADMKGVGLDEAPRAPAFGAARDQRELGARALQRRQRALDEALGPAIGVVALTDDSDLHPLSDP